MSVTTRLMTFNARGCRGIDGRVAPSRVVSAIHQERADVVALQEVFVWRAGAEADQPHWIAEQLGMHVVFCDTMPVATGLYGHAVLSRYPLQVRRIVDLPRPSWFTVEPRRLIWTSVALPSGVELQVLCTHLGLVPSERLYQARAISWMLDEVPEPHILAGDLNSTPFGQAYHLLAQRLHDPLRRRRRPATWPSPFPILALDHILVSRGVTVECAHAVPTRWVSDHRALMVELTVDEVGHNATIVPP